ncbi:TBC1 domain family member 30 [Portunus trituberculatus]|uniref:TBC1 domain family member 30 n=1 Tax=Portunus trituberculatus TaxID=210409 RepID=A0A5B7KDT3_PORTR|nr:TBC1 domain family member 30 [Portunus trituberculatus]
MSNDVVSSTYDIVPLSMTSSYVTTVVGMAPFPFPGLADLRDKYTYNITPWTQSVSSVAKRGLRLFYSDDDDDENDEDNQTIAVATAFGLSGIFRKS